VIGLGGKNYFCRRKVIFARTVFWWKKTVSSIVWQKLANLAAKLMSQL